VDQPACVLHARRRLSVFWRNAHAHSPLEEGSPLFLPFRGIDRIGYGTRQSCSEVSNGGAGRVQHTQFQRRTKSVEETAEVLGISPETTKRDWKMAKAWLLGESRDSP